MSELYQLSVFVAGCGAVLCAAYMGRMALMLLGTGCILVSNITFPRDVMFLGHPVSLGIALYSLAYPIANTLSEFSRKFDAYRLATYCVMAQLGFFFYMRASLATPAPDGDATYPHLKALFNVTPRITAAAVIASAGLFAGSTVFQYMRHRGSERTASILARSIVSTLVGQTINTVLFFGIALYGAVDSLSTLMTSALVAKAVFALVGACVVPFARPICNLHRAVARRPEVA